MIPYFRSLILEVALDEVGTQAEIMVRLQESKPWDFQGKMQNDVP